MSIDTLERSSVQPFAEKDPVKRRLNAMLGTFFDFINEAEKFEKKAKDGGGRKQLITLLQPQTTGYAQIKDAFETTVTDLCQFPESGCVAGITEGSEVPGQDVEVLVTSLETGNILCRQPLFYEAKVDGEPVQADWGYQYWIEAPGA
jgi:hypothetical protein